MSNRGYGADVEYRYALNNVSAGTPNRGQWLMSFLQDTDGEPVRVPSYPDCIVSRLMLNWTVNAQAFLLTDPIS